MFGNDGRPGAHRRSANSFETRFFRFPMQRMCQSSGRRRKWSDISGNVERLNADIAHCSSGRIAPAADFHVHFAVMLFSAPIVECGHTEVPRQAPNEKYHRTTTIYVPYPRLRVSTTSAHDHLSVFFFDAQMHRAACVCPGIVAVVQIIQSTAIASNGANFPIVSAKMNRTCRRKRKWSNPFYDLR